MNWKWEDKVDDQREKQRRYEEQKRREFSQAKSAHELRQIEKNLGKKDLSLTAIQQMQEIAMAKYEREAIQAQREMISQYYNSPIPWASAFSAWDEPVAATPPKALTEDVIIEAVVGYRAWNVPLFGGGELQSTTRGDKWPAYERYEASCASAPCKGIQCTCGIYAYKSIEEAKSGFGPTDSRYSNRVYGSISLWGRVLECTNGYRAQYAYPKEILDTGALARQMASRYGVPMIATSK